MNNTMSAESTYPQLNFSSTPYPDQNRVEARFGTFIDGRYAPWNLSSVLYADRNDDVQHVQMEVWSAPGRTKPQFKEAVKNLEKNGCKLSKGFKFGPSWTNHWVKLTVHIPKEWKKEEQIQIIFDPSCEATIFDESGAALQGITGFWEYNRRVEYIIPSDEVETGTCVRYIEVAANRMFGTGEDPPRDDKFYKLDMAEIAVPNLEAWQLKYDFDTLVQLSEVLPAQSPLRNKARRTANNVMNAFKKTSGAIAECRKIAEEVLGGDWKAELKDARGKNAEDSTGQLWALGHCHIDTAWLWPWSVTQQKVARSWTSQLDLMERYPEYRFLATQTQQYRWLEQLYPDVFKNVQDKVKAGTWEVNGGTWVEMDGNMPTGEAFCRQFLLGQRYCKTRFGKYSNIFVLPDTFGYSAQLPQLARLAGMPSFFTQKLSWSQTNKFPYTTFNWIGLDGSQLLTHMTPVNRYDSQCGIDDIYKGYSNNRNLDATPDAIILFGNSDGGGGPTAQMLERLNRARAAGVKNDAGGGELPLVRMGHNLSDYYENLRATTHNGKDLPDWVGELYLERHRGTYTSQASTKRGNRKSEILLREVELFSTLASLNSDYEYPKEELNFLWEELCRCQFHDTLPGSSITMCVKDSDATFETIFEKGQALLDKAMAHLYETGAQGHGVEKVVNPLHGYARKEVVESRRGGFGIADVPADKLVGTFSRADLGHEGVDVKLTKDGFVMSNSSIAMKVADGRIISIVDIDEDRELIPEGHSAGFNIYEDMPDNSDAWDIEHCHLEKGEYLCFDSVHITEQDPLRATVQCRLNIGKSIATVRISLDALPASTRATSRSMIRFDTTVDWREKHRFLKFELPTTIWSPEATYDTAFGVVHRPTHRNTSWDAAKFEVCAHKFADLSEFGYGVALINESKYGYAVQGNVMRLSLLRSPTEPDPICDMRRHDFSFAIYPHVGTYAESDVQPVSHAFNAPLKTVRGSATSGTKAFPFTIKGANNVMLETIKRGEDDFDAMTSIKSQSSSQSVILRLFEHMGGRARIELEICELDIAHASLVNILEEKMDDLKIKRDGDKLIVDLTFRAFEVKTVKLVLA